MHHQRKITITYFIILLLGAASCLSIKEEMFLNADGSGEYLVYTDMISASRDMMTSMMQGMNPDADPDSLMLAIEDQLWKDLPDEVDSLIDFSDKVPDSIKNDPAKQKYLERMQMFMKGSRAKGYMNSGMRFSFKNMEDLEELMELLDESSKSSGDMPMPSTKVQYEFSKNSFRRIANISEENNSMNDSSMMMLNTMLAGATWEFILHLPKQAKKATSDQLISQEGKDVVFQYDLLKVLSGEQSMDIEVEF